MVLHWNDRRAAAGSAQQGELWGCRAQQTLWGQHQITQSAGPLYTTLSGVCDTLYRKGHVNKILTALVTVCEVVSLAMFDFDDEAAHLLFRTPPSPFHPLSTPKSRHTRLPVLVAVVGAVPGNGTQLFAVATQRLG